jgi:hypothetical protein
MTALYHGSNFLLTREISPRKSHLLDGEAAVFATNLRWLALVFIPRSTNDDLDIGFWGDEPYVEEMYAGAFNLLRGMSGYVYTVDAAGFHGDPRLGLVNHELIRDSAVPIAATEFVPDVFEALKKTGVRLTEFASLS